ncbi:MAG: type I restriction endonuclease subunit R [Candidatus Contendobacter sp.]|nr:type I restriction endonuclease subunit R [Candidatus Contendobacter sp.]
MNDDLPSFLEDHISQIPALQLLQNLGWRYLTPGEAVALRGRKPGNVLLESVLVEQLRKLNRIRFKGEEYEFSEANIQTAVQVLKDVLYDGLVRTNEKIYDLLILGKSLQQTICGDTKSFPLHYIDWNPDTRLTSNVFHVTEEFEVERTASHETRRPDIVLFVNGIPLVVIECKRPDLKDPIAEAISQHLRNQRDDEIPKLFLYAQLLLVLSKNEAQYATTGTAAKFWAVWREEVDRELAPLISRRKSKQEDVGWLMQRFQSISEAQADYFRGPREITAQDRALYSLCRPERLLDLTFNFIVFDAGEKKIARYQQYFTVRNILERIQQRDADGRRLGGVVWHTQGSGKSLTMVMLAKAIARLNLPDYKIVLVTDRVDLDDQIYRTFSHCDLEPHQARSGKDLAKQVAGPKSRVVTTIIDKFENAVLKANLRNESDNVFVLVDESHRGQYGAMHGRMRKALPNACFIGFTGTPVRKKEKDTINRFGGLIQPTYSIRRAVEDRAVVPLLYEGRDVEQRVDRQSIDRWFDVITSNLTKEQKADLKKKFTTTDQLNKAEQKVREIALDISLHFRDHWQGTPYKAQLVTQDKATALLYQKYLNEFGMVSSDVLISGPDDREGNEEVDEEHLPAVQQFWKKMMARHGSEEQYNKNLINGFKSGDDPEIIIVVDKLLTGFDAPRNTVLYLTRQLQDHTLLQAIARVNRLCDGKDFGYIIDYRGVLQNLNQAFDLYGKMEEYDQADLEATLTDVAEEIDKLPRRHTDLLNLFQDIKNQQDEEQYERKLADAALRERFYERLRDFGRSLAIALSSTRFVEQTPDAKIVKYRKDLTFFMKLRTAVRRRYAEVVDFKEYEAKIQKLIDTHVSTGAVEKVTALVNIFDQDAFLQELERLEGTASRADTIAHRTKKTIEERMDEDPAFYRKFSELLEAAIRAFREQRLADRDYLAKVSEIADAIRTRKDDNLPASIRQREVAKAFHGVVREALAAHRTDGGFMEKIAEAAMAIDDTILRERIVNWTTNADVQNRMRNDIEDALFDLKSRAGLDLSFDEIDAILEKCLDIARRRYPG